MSAMHPHTRAGTRPEKWPAWAVRMLWLLLAVCCGWLAWRSIASTWLQPHTDPTWERMTRSGVLRVGMDATYPPFDTFDGAGQFAGYDVDLVTELGRRWGVRVSSSTSTLMDCTTRCRWTSATCWSRPCLTTRR